MLAHRGFGRPRVLWSTDPAEDLRPKHVEVPIEVDREDGTRLRGRIDLLVDTSEGWVDHKSSPCGAAHDEGLVREHGPQLASYADALMRATARLSYGLEFGETNPDDPAHIARAWKQSVLQVFRPLEIGR